MKDLSRHIEYLLCEHDSVAIPGIGVFITEELPARYYPEESLYLPPVRSVHLDTTNKDDDHKLEDCLIQLHHVTRSIANKWIFEYVNDINQSLMDMGIMDMGTIGRLVYVNGKMSFEVCDAGVNAPEMYGLDSFHIAKLPAHAHKNSGNTDHTHLTIRLRRTTIHRVMTAAAMIIVALTVIVPNYTSFNNLGLQASLNSAKSLTNMFGSTAQPITDISAKSSAKKPTTDESIVADAPTSVSQQTQDTYMTTQKADNISDVPQPAITESDTVATSLTQANPIADIPATKVDVNQQTAVKTQTPEDFTDKAEVQSLEVSGFCIVMASAITNKGAEHLIAKLNKEGFPNAVKYNDRGMLRVLLTGYDSETSARAHIAVVRATDELYSGSWIKQF